MGEGPGTVVGPWSHCKISTRESERVDIKSAGTANPFHLGRQGEWKAPAQRDRAAENTPYQPRGDGYKKSGSFAQDG